ncbi:MAG: glutamate--tRNA ligase [Gammaproteobacteria bacterium]
MIKTRFAPSPTGYIHLGNMRTALFNAMIARHQQGIFLLRIEDTDEARSEEIYIGTLKEDLRWLGLDWQEGEECGGPHAPYRQSERHGIYESYYNKLIEMNLAYPCFCSDEQLKLSRKMQRVAGQPPRYDGRCARLSLEEIAQKTAQGLKATLRFRIPRAENVVFQDLVQGEKIFATDDIGDFIIRREDGGASFMFCNAIDDSLMEVTHAFRGEDHLTNTPRQLLIAKALGLTPPQYGHFALINGTDGSPLSKRNGSQSIREMREKGFWPEAVVNYLARLGHYYPQNELMSIEDLGRFFEISQLGRSPARYDENQLMYWQKEAFKIKSPDEVFAWMGDAVQSMVPEDKKALFVDIVTPNTLFPHDAVIWGERAFNEDVLSLMNEECQAMLKAIPAGFFDHALAAVKAHGLDYKAWIDYLKEHAQAKGKALFQPLRIALMATLHGPEMDKWVMLLGDEALITKRLNDARQWVIQSC